MLAIDDSDEEPSKKENNPPKEKDEFDISDYSDDGNFARKVQQKTKKPPVKLGKIQETVEPKKTTDKPKKPTASKKNKKPESGTDEKPAAKKVKKAAPMLKDDSDDDFSEVTSLPPRDKSGKFKGPLVTQNLLQKYSWCLAGFNLHAFV